VDFINKRIKLCGKLDDNIKQVKKTIVKEAEKYFFQYIDT